LPVPVAAATSHLGLFGAVVVFGFAVGAWGHLIHSRALIVIGIVVIGCVSLWFVAAGEVHTFPS
jgi:hypothetical protein